MSDYTKELDEIVKKQHEERGGIEKSIFLLWWEMVGYEDIANTAAQELAGLRALIRDMDINNEAARDSGFGAWTANSELQKRINEEMK